MAVGRDPKPGIIMPMYEPPDGVSRRGSIFAPQKFDHRVFSAAILNLAAKGYLIIERNDHREFSLSRTKSYIQMESRLSPDETAVARKLFAGGETVACAGGNPTPHRRHPPRPEAESQNTVEKSCSSTIMST